MAETRVERSAILPFTQAELFAMVGDVRSYPEFLPWCDGVDVLAESDQEVTARVSARAAGVSQSFVTCNRMHPEDAIDLSLVEGPFERLTGRWEFTALGDGTVSGCKLALDMRFELSRRNPLLRRTFGALFERASATLVESFCERAQTLYGAGA